MTYLSLVESPDIQTPSHRVHATSHFNLHFNLHNNQQRIRLTLEPNHDILPEGATITHLGSDGQILRHEPVSRRDHKIFKGQSWVRLDDSWIHAGWARIVVRRDGIDPLFEGAFSINRDHHHVQLKSYYMSTKHEMDPELEPSDDEYMVIYRDSDIGKSYQTELKRSLGAGPGCQAHLSPFNTDLKRHAFAPMVKRDVGFWGSMPMSSLFGKRQIDTNGIPGGGNGGLVNLKDSIGKTDGCPSTRKVALIGVVTDCTYTGTFNSTQSAHANVITQVNSASNIYEKTFNITLGLQNLTTIEASCPTTPPPATAWNLGCGGNTTITDRLNLFSDWRGNQVADSNAYWTLLTNCRTESEVGLAWLGQACVRDVTKSQGETVSGANVVAKTGTEWQVIAHESGHTFGAVHDCDGQTCGQSDIVNSQQCCPLSRDTCDAGSKYIMNPSTGEGIENFSPCSIGNICSAIGRNSVKTQCLSNNKGVTTITGHQCGNGIVEEDEDCDCGGEESCQGNSCCDPKTCKFTTGAVCDDSNQECCKSCQFASSGTVCRASTGVCDPQETCSGTNATCPSDVSAPDGQRCGDSSAGTQCASGQCTSRTQQCKTLMGSYTTRNDTYACNSQDCSLSCASPEFGPGVCYSMQQNFLDGTTCGGGGRCQNGQCKGSSVAKEVGSWIHDHQKIVIGVAVGIGVLLLFAILSCCIRRCRQPRRRYPKRVSPPPPLAMSGGWPGARGQPPMGQYPNQPRGPTGGWQGDGQFWSPHPPQPPPHFSGPSVRYA